MQNNFLGCVRFGREIVKIEIGERKYGKREVCEKCSRFEW